MEKRRRRRTENQDGGIGGHDVKPVRRMARRPKKSQSSFRQRGERTLESLRRAARRFGEAAGHIDLSGLKDAAHHVSHGMSEAAHYVSSGVVKAADHLAHHVGGRTYAEEAQYTSARSRRLHNRRKEQLRLVLMGVCGVTALVCVVMIGQILLRTLGTNTLNSTLSQRREQAMASSEPTFAGAMTPAPASGFIVFSGGDGEIAMPDLNTPAPTPVLAAEPKRTPEPIAAAQATKAPDIVTSTKYHHIGGDALPEMEMFYGENRDLIGWLIIEDVIDQPVVYRDNSYYLTHDFYGNKTSAGTLFLDVNHPFKAGTQHLLLHGHNMKDGTMFGRLIQYEKDIHYLKSHPFIEFNTLWRRERYVIVAVLDVSLDVSDEDFFNYYSYPTFSSDAAFNAFARQLQLRSMYSIPIDIKPGDALLTMSTCLDDNRLVIVARRIRDDESKSDLRPLINLAEYQ